MKKLGVLIAFAISLSISAQQSEHLINSYTEQESSPTKSSKKTYFAKAKTANVLWSEDFSNGIPAGWTNQGHTGNPNFPLPNALWEYRGVNTTPDLAIGSRGAWSGTQTPIASPTASNGFVIFDSDFLDNNGVQGAAGSGSAPTPHVGVLTTDTIDLSSTPYVKLKIHSYSRYFAGRNLVGFSNDGGATWTDVHINVVPVNAYTSNDLVTDLDISSYVGGSANAMLRFTFDGDYNEPGANGNGYYYWMLDDISIEELDQHALTFTTYGDSPSTDILFGGEERTGNMLVNQVRPISFDANVRNFGVDTQTTVLLEVDVYKNGNLFTTLRSDTVASLLPGDTANYNQLYTPTFLASGVGEYKCLFRAVSDSISPQSSGVALDTSYTFWVNSLDSTTVGHSLDFRSFDNSIGTPQLGDDGSALASSFSFPNATDTINGVPKVAVTHMDINFSTLTVNGGDVQLECYAGTGLDLINGFAAAPLFSKTFNLNSHSGSVGRFDIRSCQSAPVYLTPDSVYFFVVTMFSNGGTNLIRIANDQTVTQPGNSSIMYNSGDARWYTGYAGGSRTFTSPHIRVINLADTINSSISGVDVHRVCGSNSFTWINGVTYTSNNNTDTHLVSTTNGCDSLVRLDLTFGAPNAAVDVVQACGPHTWIDGNTYTTNNNSAFHTLTNVSGCDSVVVLNLTINTPTSGVDSYNTCDSLTWIDGITYTSNNNTATYTLMNVNGCDSVVALDLTIAGSSSSYTDAQQSCQPFTWIDGNTYFQSNSSATFILPNAQGCDSLVALDLTIHTVDVSVLSMDTVLVANATNAQYQWMMCDSNGVYTPISGDTAQSYSVLQNGSYAVQITDSLCTDTSACISITNISLEENNVVAFSVYPNPSKGEVNIQLDKEENFSLKVLDLNGRLIFEEANMLSEDYQFQLNAAPGVYFIHLKIDGENQYQKLLIE